MPIHGGIIAGIVTGAVNGVVSLASDFLANRGQPSAQQQATDLGLGTGQVPGVTQLPVITPGAAPIQAGVGSLVAPVGALAGTLIRRVIGPAAVVGGIGSVLTDIFEGGGQTPMTRRQQILAVARASSPGATAKKIVRSARECGIELAAATFGLNVLDVCFLIAQPPSRRSRGISAADMRRTRSTIRKVTTIQKQLKALSGPGRRR